MFVWFIYLYFFWKIGDPFPILSPKQVSFCKLIFVNNCSDEYKELFQVNNK